jgi:hypothetical protein|tara:strand:- start:848 stop:1555 length:708 start_codon:yes stop_codon:yes gene_type:complete
MKTMASSKKDAAIVLPPLNIQEVDITIVGDTSLITNCWSKKAIDMMRGKQTGEPTPKKAPKVPFDDFVGSMYWMDEMPEEVTWDIINEARFGMPAIGLKNSAVTACTSVANVTKVAARQAFRVPGGDDPKHLVEIHAPPPIMREDLVRVGMGTADLRYRGEFWPWHVNFKARLNLNVISIGELVNLFNTAGQSVGIFEWRMEKDGDMGVFHVATEEEINSLPDYRSEATMAVAAE